MRDRVRADRARRANTALRTRTLWIFAALAFALLAAPAAQAERAAHPAVTYPELRARAQKLEDFVPAHWRLEHVVGGQLDDTPGEDALLLLRMSRDSNILRDAGPGAQPFDTNPRMLVAVLADGDGYRRVMSDHALVPRPHDPAFDDYLGDDPASAIAIHPNRTFSVALHSWASAGTWTTRALKFTFRLEAGCARLIGYDHSDLHRASLESTATSVNYLSRRAWTRSGSMTEDIDDPQTWTRLARGPRLCIEDVGDGLSFDPEV